jgi:geranylgeranylglycerol-phosphate geranylgeranyltransferase
VLAYLKILRPSVVALFVLGVVVGAIIEGFWSLPMIAIAVAVVALASAGGNIVNDIFDYEIDKVNRPKRPLPSGRISMKAAKAYAIILLAASVVLAVVFLNPLQLLLAVFNGLLAFVYPWRLKGMPLLGNLCVSWVAASAILFGALFVGIGPTALLLFLMAFFANTGREIVKTIEDVPGDKKAGYKTLPIALGKNFSAAVAILFVVFAVLLTPLPWALGLLDMKYLYVVFVSDIVFAVSCYVLLMNPSRAQLLMKIAMFIGVLSFIFGVL